MNFASSAALEGLLAFIRAVRANQQPAKVVDLVITRVDTKYAESGTLVEAGLRIREWLVRDEAEAFFVGIEEKGLPNADELASFVQTLDLSDLYVGDQSAEAIVLEVLSDFFTELRNEILKGPDAIPILTKTMESRFDNLDSGQAQVVTGQAQIVAEIRSLRENILSGSTIEQPIVADYGPVKDLLREGRATSALRWLERREKTIKTAAARDELYDLHANLGLAHMQLSHLAEAETEFRRAADLKPQRGNAIANVGLIVLIQSRYDEARNYAERALELEPDNQQALEVLAQALIQIESFKAASEVALRIPDERSRARILGFLNFREDRFEEAIGHLRTAVTLKPDDADALFYLVQAEAALVQRRVREQGLAPWGDWPSELRELFEDATTSIDRSISLYRERETPLALGNALMTRAGIRAYRDDLTALDDYTEAVRQGAANGDAAASVAGVLFRQDKRQESFGILATFRNTGSFHVDVEFYYSAIASALGKTDEALEVLDNPKLAAAAGEGRVLQSKFDALIDANRLDEAEGVVNDYPTTSEPWRKALMQSRLESARSNWQEAARAHEQAIENAPPAERTKLRVLLADIYLHDERWGDAHVFLRELATTRSLPGLIRRYLVALFNDQHLRECIEFAQKVREERGLIPEIADIEVRALAAVGRLDDAQQVSDELVASGDTRVVTKLERAQIALRRGDPERALQELPHLDQVGGVSLSDAMVVAQIHEMCGDAQGALEVAHRARATHVADPDAHLRYVGLFLRVSPNLETVLNPKTVEIGSCVTIERDGHKDVFEITSDGNPAAHQCRYDDPLGKRLMGRAVGNMIVGKADRYGSEEWNIIEIKSKYVVAFQESITGFNTRFPDADGLRRIVVSPEDPVRVLQAVDERSQHLKGVRELYQKNLIPVTFLSRLTGLNDVELWYGCISGTFGFFYAYPPEPEHRRAMIDDCAAADTLVLDASSICALAELGLLRELAALNKKLIIPQATLDLLETIRANLSPEPASTLSKTDFGYALQEHPAEQLRRRGEFWEVVLAWTRQNAKVRPFDVPPGSEYKRLSEVLTDPALATILLARSENACLVVEDGRLRAMVKNEHGTPGCGSIELVDLMLESKLIDAERLQQALVRTVRWNYHFTSVSHVMLLSACKLDGYSVGDNVIALLKPFEEPDTTDDSIATVTSAFLRDVWLDGAINAQRRQAIAIACLEALAKRPAPPYALRLLDAQLAASFKLLPIQLAELREIVRAWLRSRK